MKAFIYILVIVVVVAAAALFFNGSNDTSLVTGSADPEVPTSVIEINSDDIHEVSVLSSKDEFTMRRFGDQLHLLGDVDVGLINQEAAQAFFNAIANLSAEGFVSPELSDEQAGVAGYELLNVHTLDKFTYEYRIGAHHDTNGMRAVRILVHNNPEPKPTKIQAQIESGKTFVPPDEPALVDAAVMKHREDTLASMLSKHAEDERARIAKAERLTQELATRRFLISEESYLAVTPRRQDLIK